MIRPRWRKVLSDLWGGKTRSLLVVASICVGLFAVGLIINMDLMITQDMRTGYQAVNPANIRLAAGLFDQDLVDRMRHLPGVRQAEGSTALTLRVRSASGEWKPIDLQAFPQISDRQLNGLTLEQGAWPPQDKEIVVDSYKLDELPAGVGGTIELELPSGKVRQLKLVGAVNDQTTGFTGAGGFFLAPVQGYITLDTLTWLEMPPRMNRLDLTVTGDPSDQANLRQVANRASQAVEDAGRSVSIAAIRASDDHPNRVYVEAIAAVLVMLSFLVMFLSGSLITNTLSALLNQQVHQIGILKMIGARRGKIMGIYMVEILLYGLVAFAIAQPLSNWAGYTLLGVFARQINIALQGFRVFPQVVILQLAIALVAPQVAGFVPILNGTRITAVEALSGYSQSHLPGADGWMTRQVAALRGLPRPVLLSLRNTFRRRGRLILTLFTLTLGGAIFIATFNAQGSLASYIARIGRYFLADVNVTLAQPYRMDAVMETLREVPGVGSVEAWAVASGQVILPDGSLGERIEILAPPSTSQLVRPVLLEGRWIIPGDQNAIAVNERTRERFPDLTPGSTLRVRLDGQERDLVVVGSFQMAGKSAGYLGYSTFEYLAQETHQATRPAMYRVIGSRPNLSLAEQKQLSQAIETTLRDHGYAIGEIEPGHTLTATTATGLSILTTFLLVMALLTALVGSIGLAGTMSMNVMERTRELGILRAIGASDGAIIRLVMSEGLLIGLMSWALGVALAIPISSLLSNAIIQALFGATADFTFTPTGIILWLGIVLVLSATASLAPARSAARLTIREVLAYE